MTTTNLQREIDTLAQTEYLVETNEGTFGAAECCRAVGCGDPRFGNYSIYETVGGAKRHVGCDPEVSPGRARRLNRDALANDRKRLEELRRELRLG